MSRFIRVVMLSMLGVSVLAGGNATAADTLARTTTVQVTAVFDYPSAGVIGTRPRAVNAAGDISVQLSFASGEVAVGLRHADGSYDTPLQDPSSSAYTSPAGINSSDVIVGAYVSAADGLQHGFKLQSGSFTDFNVTAAGATCTDLEGIDNSGNLVGAYCSVTPSAHVQAFTQIGSKQSDIQITGAVGSSAASINAFQQVVGYYSTADATLQQASCACHGFLRQRNSSVVSFDPPGSVSTIVLGINNSGWIVGRYYDSSGVLHGFVRNSAGAFSIYDYPGATQTSLNGINNAGTIAGRYTDSSGIAHGFIAKLVTAR